MNHLLVDNLNVSFNNKSFLKGDTSFRNIQFEFKNKHITVEKVIVNKDDHLLKFINLYTDQKLLNIEINHDIKSYLEDLLDYLKEQIELYGLTFLLDNKI